MRLFAREPHRGADPTGLLHARSHIVRGLREGQSVETALPRDHAAPDPPNSQALAADEHDS